MEGREGEEREICERETSIACLPHKQPGPGIELATPEHALDWDSNPLYYDARANISILADKIQVYFYKSTCSTLLNVVLS